MRIPLLLLIGSLACVMPTPVTDPHASGANMNQWKATIVASTSSVFDAAMQVLSDSSYKIADAHKDAGVIKTEYRKESDVQRGTAQLKTITLGTDYPVRLQLLVLAKGQDSTTVTITGEGNVLNQTVALSAGSGYWRFVRGVGEAILAALPR